MKNIYFLILLIILYIPNSGFAQSPEQECANAIPVCQDVFFQPNSYSGYGNEQEVPASSCLGEQEKNSVWYILNIQSGGDLEFTIDPVDSGDDYDFAIYNISGLNCSDIYIGVAEEVRCNYCVTPGMTGLSSTPDAGESEGCCDEPCLWGPLLPVNAGETYVLVVSNYSSSADGYTLDFSASTADIYDITPPTVVTAQGPCGENYFTLTLSEPALCSSIAADGSDFSLTGPGGPYTITGAVGENCGSFSSLITVYITPPLIIGSNYTLTVSTGSDGNTLIDNCDNEMADPTTFDFTATSPPASISGDNNICEGSSTTLTASQGTAYIWNTTETSQSITVSPTSSTTYSVTVTNGTCSESASINVNVDDAPTADFSYSPSTVCVGQQVDFTNNSSTGCFIEMFFYTWSFGDGGFSISENPNHTYNSTGTYTVSLNISDLLCGCDNEISQDITVIDCVTCSLTVSTTQTDVLCNGDCNGSATAVGDNGTLPYSYLWDPATGGQTTAIAINLCEGIYTVTATDAALCTATASVTITEPSAPLTSSGITTDETSPGACDGTINLTPSGGTGSYTFIWSNTETTEDLSGLCSGTYLVTITDDNGCTATNSFDISDVPCNLTASITASTDVSCYGDCDGSATAAGDNGTLPYSYLWDPTTGGQTTAIAINLCEGIYTVTVTDAVLCTATASVTITEPPALTSSGATTDETSPGACDGTIDLTPAGGTGPGTYIFIWSNTETTEDLSGLCAGFYTVTITDNNGCTATNTFQIFDVPCTLTASITVNTNVTCNGDCDGSATVTPANGNAPYTYNWSNGATIENPGNLCAGVHNVTVTDNDLCTATAGPVTITEPPLLESSGTSTDESSPGACDGTIDLIPAGGTPTYTYIWDNAETTEDLSGLCSGWYYVTITDDNGCTATNSFYINDVPCALTASITASTNVLCNGDCNGTATVSPASGTAPFIYNWSNGATIENPDNLCAGTHNVTVTDADSCNATASVNITEPPQLTVSTGGSTSICSGESEMISAFASGGTGTIIYSWGPTTGLVNPNDPNPIASPTTTTTYTVTVTDDNSCTATGSVIITVFTSLTITLSTNDDTICAGVPATIDANIVGGNPPYLITLDGVTIVSPPFTVYPDITTVYIVTVEVDCGQPGDTITIVVLPAPPANMDANPLQGCEPLTVQFLENALNPDTLGQTYLWDFGDETISTDRNPEHTFENAGSYDITLTVTSKYGCTTIISNPDMITVYPQPDAGFSAEPQTVSILKPIIFFNNHSSYTDTCYWNFGDSLSSTNLSNNINPDHTYSSPGTYTVQLIVATGYGCRDTVESEILVKDEFTFYAPTAFSPDKDKLNDIFLPVGVGIDPDNFFMLIYDRWGEKVFVTHDKYQGWDGRIKGKEIGENGIYTWLVIYKDLQKVEHQEAGSVNLIR